MWTLLRSLYLLRAQSFPGNLDGSFHHLVVDALLVALRPGPLLHVRFLCTVVEPWKVLPSSTRADCRSIVQCNNPYRRGTILNLPCVSSVTVAWKKHTSRLQNPWPMNCFNWIRDKAPERGQIHRTELSRFPACPSRIRSNSTE